MASGPPGFALSGAVVGPSARRGWCEGLVRVSTHRTAAGPEGLKWCQKPRLLLRLALGLK